MRWGGALVALFLCLVVCLLVVAFRVRTLELRRTIQDVQRESLHVEAERARFVRRILYMRRRGVLEARYRAEHAADRRNADRRNADRRAADRRAAEETTARISR